MTFGETLTVKAIVEGLKTGELRRVLSLMLMATNLLIRVQIANLATIKSMVAMDKSMTWDKIQVMMHMMLTRLEVVMHMMLTRLVVMMHKMLTRLEVVMHMMLTGLVVMMHMMLTRLEVVMHMMLTRLVSDDAQDVDKTGSGDAHDVDKTGGGDAHDADRISSDDAHDVDKTGGGDAHDADKIGSDDAQDVDKTGGGDAHDADKTGSDDAHDVDKTGGGDAHDADKIGSGDAHDVGKTGGGDSPDVDMTCGRAHDVGQTCSSDSPDVDMTCGRAHDVGQTCSGDSPDVDMTCGRAHDVGQTCSSDSPDVDMICGRAHDVGQTCSGDSPDVDMTCGRAHDVGQTCSGDSPDVDMTCCRAHDVGQTCSGDSPDVDMTCGRAHDVGQTCSGDSPDVDMTCRDGGHDVGKTLNNDTHDVDKTYECRDVCDKSVDETLVGKTPSKDNYYVRALSDDSWFVHGLIGTDSVEWLIDSGAGPSLLDYGVYTSLDPSIRPSLMEYSVSLVAAAGAPLKVYGQIAVEVKFGKTEFVIPLVVTDLGGLQGILGNMFIRSAEDVEFDLRRGTMSMGSEVYYLHERAGEGDCFVRLEQVVEVPGNHEVQVVGRVSPNWPLATCDRGLVEAARDFSCSRDCPSGSGEGCGTQGPGNGVETTEYVEIAARTLSDARDQVVGDALANDVVACIWDQEKGTQELGTHMVVGNVDGTCNPLTEQEVQIDLERQSVLENDIIVGCDPLQSQGDCCHATQVDSSSQRDPGPMMKKRVVLRTSESDAMTTKEPEHRKRKLGRHKDQLCDGFGLCSRPHERDRPTELRPKVMTVTDQAGGRPPDQSKECNGFNIWSNTDLHGPQKDDLANPDTGGIKTSAGQQRRHPWNHHRGSRRV